MHELSITQELLDLALSEAKKVSAAKIGKINLVIGEMSGVVDESVRFYFDFLSKDTIAQGAMLNIKRVSKQARCRDCGKEFELEEFNWVCPNCKGNLLEITAGSELFLESIEVEQDGNKNLKEHT
jgi:hydrogenase nickel incorporation protein HypA/HybF